MSNTTRQKPRQRPHGIPLLGVGDILGAGDSYLVTDMLPPELAEVAFEKLKTGVKWQTMYHRGGEVPRLVAVEGEVGEDGSFPVYRHPADESPPLSQFSPTVAIIRDHVQNVLNHPVNYVLIQFYRSGKDYISEHADKTIDVVHGSNIVNVSLGAQRTMTLRVKKDKKVASSTEDPIDHENPDDSPIAGSSTPRSAQRIPLPHNSMFVMGLETNAKWLHALNHDNRPLKIKSPEEQLEGGGRISLTFRHIGTFLSKDESRIWGQGAKSKSKEEAGLVKYDQREVEMLLLAFGEENHKSDFDWAAAYGTGFDVLHFTQKDAKRAGSPSQFEEMS